MAIFYQSVEKFPAADTACIVVHGLNNRPEVLKDIIDLLETLSFPVIAVSLTGHLNDSHKLRDISQEMWDQDLLEAYALARTRLEKINLVAYSIGAAIGLDVLSERVRFNKMILLAPAIAPRSYVKLLRFLAPLSPSFPLYSIAPKDYLANPYLPLKTYEVLLQLFASLKAKAFAYANVPAIVVMDEKDETMDIKILQKMLVEYHLNNWEIFRLDSRITVEAVKFHHLIINKKAMGMKNWENFSAKVSAFLR